MFKLQNQLHHTYRIKLTIIITVFFTLEQSEEVIQLRNVLAKSQERVPEVEQSTLM